jgi:endonuclease-8
VPEGDSLEHAAQRLQPIVGSVLEAVDGSHRAVAPSRRRLTGRTVTEVFAVGKHLLIHLDGQWSIRTHLGMSGSWQLYRREATWSRSPGKARLTLRTATHVAVCFSAPTVEIGPTTRVLDSIAHLGPDLLHDEFDPTVIVERAGESSAVTAADLLLDQRVMCGIGNVYKSEILFLQRIAPAAAANSLSAADIEGLARRAQRLLRANQRPGPRSTTGRRGRNVDMWVYGRAGRPCRRCAARIQSETHGDLERVSYWCPRCQATEFTPCQ